jgi:hypothetical protein
MLYLKTFRRSQGPEYPSNQIFLLLPNIEDIPMETIFRESKK